MTNNRRIVIPEGREVKALLLCSGQKEVTLTVLYNAHIESSGLKPKWAHGHPDSLPLASPP